MITQPLKTTDRFSEEIIPLLVKIIDNGRLSLAEVRVLFLNREYTDVDSLSSETGLSPVRNEFGPNRVSVFRAKY